MGLEPQQLLSMYRQMVTIRVFDQRAVEEFHAGNIPGVVHAYIGQEAIAVGVCTALRRDDKIVSTHRGHGHTIAKGADPKFMMAELFGRANGYCHGKGGSMHIADFSVGMLGANGIVGAGLPIATGAALAAQLAGSDGVAVAFFGDGASSEGSFHGSLNLASIWKLPVIFVCENNHWAVAVPSSYALAVPEVSARAVAYNLPGVLVDGADVLAVCEAMTHDNITVEVVDPRTLVPMDKETLRASVRKTGRVVIVDEACLTCSAAAEIAAMLTEDATTFRALQAPPRRVCAPDVPIPYSPIMERFCLPDTPRIVAAIKEVLA